MNTEDGAKHQREYWKIHPEKYEIQKKRAKQYWAIHPEQYEKNKERTRTRRNTPLYYLDWRTRIKIEVLSHYSPHGIPECCNPFGEHDKPYTTLDALSIDHINNNGAEHRKEISKGNTNIYSWLKKNNFPEGFQTLCMNCQFIKRMKYKII